ncbi:MAG: hypothetical protein K9N10_22625 [Deltaproteobacteria bacterium]|nr:hypothetical protein [Deltaproteobacteria bacterium]
MGHIAGKKCLDCGCTFMEEHGGGFSFHLVRCDECGGTKQIGFDEIGELHLQYLKGLDGAYCIASSEHDKNVQEHAQVDPITEDEYNRGIDVAAGKCECGGKYTLDAPHRCPECRSTNLEEGEVGIMYD